MIIPCYKGQQNTVLLRELDNQKNLIETAHTIL